MKIEEIPLAPASLRRGGSQNRDDAVFLSFARSSARILIERCSLGGNSSLLDIGCGPARLLYGILGELGEIRIYVGVDVDKRAIDWLKANVQPVVLFSRFEHLSFFNKRYNKGPDATSAAPAIPGENFDVVALLSVFSHMWFKDIELYLKVIGSKLSARGSCYLTMFVEDDVPLNEENPEGYFGPWKGNLHCVRINRQSFEEAVARAGLKVRDFKHQAYNRGQSIYILQR